LDSFISKFIEGLREGPFFFSRYSDSGLS